MKIIFAPHADDELIGCYEIIRVGDPCLVIYTSKMSKERKIETNKVSEYFDNLTTRCEPDYYHSYGLLRMLMNEKYYEEFYFPDPFNELHPEHKMLGFHGYKAWKENDNLNIIFYSTNMNTNYLHELDDNSKNMKEAALNSIYPSQSDLWKYEKKYIFFEGRIKFLK